MAAEDALRLKPDDEDRTAYLEAEAPRRSDPPPTGGEGGEGTDNVQLAPPATGEG